MKKFLVFALPLFLFAFVLGCSSNDELNEGDVIALVNGEEVYAAEYLDMVEQYKMSYAQQGLDFETEEGEEMLVQIEEHALETLIQQEVLLQASARAEMLATAEQIQEELAVIVEQFDSTEEYEQALQMNGYTEDSFKEMLMLELSIENLLYAQVEPVDEVTQEEKEEFYAQLIMQYEMQGQEAPEFEEIEEMIEAQVIQQKEQMQMQNIVQSLMDDADIERLI